ncbi:MAG: DegT/DnrJ/EryC1/StrS family aminotransferase, partial [Gammaproteobacteria bacterium]
ATPVRNIPVSQPVIGDLEIEYVMTALRQGAISGFYGEYLTRFESEFAAYCGTARGVATSSGTTALHLALAALSVGRGDEVLVSTLTNMASVFAVLYQDATPVPIDIEPETWNLDPALLERHVTPRTKAILVVHLFGHPVDMDPVLAVARRHGLKVIEDCAEAHGALYRGRKIGGLGDVGCFSFYANKIITTGEGGMLTTNDRDLAERATSLKNLAFGPTNKFMHTAVGFNYRMTNLQAAVGCAQLRSIDTIIEKKRRVARWYTERLADVRCLQLPVERAYARSVYWMYHVGLTGALAGQRDAIRSRLAASGVETREGFIPANLQDVFQRQGWARADSCPRANIAARSTFYLPSGPSLTEEEVDYVSTSLKGVLQTM